MEESRVRYRNVIMDNARWEGFAFRDGDIVISTPPKCGTTWTQTICALLIFQTPDLPERVDVMSPWFDQLVQDRDEMVAGLERQQHRRFIKSHTPLDGLPFDEAVTYICVARDPRDVAISMDHHMQNMDIGALLALREAAVGLDDLAELMPDGPPPPPPESERDRFWDWIELADELRGLAATLHHLDTFFKARERPNVVLLHYGDLKADLEGEMRRLAVRLGIDVPEKRWPGLVHAASFEHMRSNATRFAPNATRSIWHDPDRFFHSGKNGQWRDLLDDADLQRYNDRVKELADEELARWVHRGPVL